MKNNNSSKNRLRFLAQAEFAFLKYLETEAPIEEIIEEIKKEENNLKNLEFILKDSKTLPELSESPMFISAKQELEISQMRLAVLNEILARKHLKKETPLTAKLIFWGVILFGLFISFLLYVLIGNWVWLIWGILVLIFIFGSGLPFIIWLTIQLLKKGGKIEDIFKKKNYEK